MTRLGITFIHPHNEWHATHFNNYMLSLPHETTVPSMREIICSLWHGNKFNGDLFPTTGSNNLSSLALFSYETSCKYWNTYLQPKTLSLLGLQLPTQSSGVVWWGRPRLGHKTSFKKQQIPTLKSQSQLFSRFRYGDVSVENCYSASIQVIKTHPMDQTAPNSPDTIPRVLSPSSNPCALKRREEFRVCVWPWSKYEEKKTWRSWM